MKILVISSSPRKTKSQTFLLANSVLESSLREEDVEIIHLCDKKIEFCEHCEKCHIKIMDCPIKDDAFSILQKMLEADAIILASPNYINQVTASMKALFDRSSHFIHCRRLLGKYITGVVSSGSGQDEDILNYMRYYAHVCGAQYSGGISSRAPISKDTIEAAAKFGNKMLTCVKEKKIFPEQMEIINRGKGHFKQIILIRKNEWLEEYNYWKDKSWL